MKNSLSKKDPAEMYARLRQLIATTPSWHEDNQSEVWMWLGRAQTLVREVLGSADEFRFHNAREGILSYGPNPLMAIIYTALADAEHDLPPQAQGGFVATGDYMGALGEVARIFRQAESSILFVDAFLDQNILTEFATSAPDSVTLCFLADEKDVKPGFMSAVGVWRRQHGATRPIEARLAGKGKLHDRFIAVDNNEIWEVGQSFNRMVTRSPTTFTRLVEREIADPKLKFYQQLWDDSKIVP
jgi:hypothetical protein